MSTELTIETMEALDVQLTLFVQNLPFQFLDKLLRVIYMCVFRGRLRIKLVRC
jgi:hypothetical protein